MRGGAGLQAINQSAGTPLGKMDATTSLAARAHAGRGSRRISPVTIAAALAGLALALRLVDLGARPLWLDEAYSAWFSSRGWHELWTVVPTYETHPPLYYSSLKLWRSLFGGSAVALRSLSVLIGAATVPVVVACAFEWGRSKGRRPLVRATVAGLLTACSPMLVGLSQEPRPYPLMAFAYAVAILGVLRLMREFASGAPGAIGSWAALGVGTELVLWSHAIGPLYGLCIALALLPAWLQRPIGHGRIVRGVAAALAVAVLYLPCLLMMAQRVGDWDSGWLQWTPGMALQLVGLYTVSLDHPSILSIVGAALLLLLAVRAVVAAIRAPAWNADRAILLLWAGPPLLSVLISIFFVPIFLPRTLAATIVAASLALAGGVAGSDSARERVVLTIVLAIALIPAALRTAQRSPSERWDQVSAYLQSRVGPRDQVWFYPNDSMLPLLEAGFVPLARLRGVPGDYPAAGFNGVVRGGSPAVPSLTPRQAQALANSPAVREPATIWLVTRRSDVFDPAADLPRALGHVRRAGPARSWPAISVQPFYHR